MNEKIYDGALHKEIQQQEAAYAEQHNTHPLGTELIKRFAKEVLQLIKEGLLRDGMVRIHNFGTFRLKMSKARTGVNPQTREPIKIPPRARVIFAPAKTLRASIEPNPKPIVPIAATEPVPRKPEPPKTENPIAVTLPPQANANSGTNSNKTDTKPGNIQANEDHDIIAGATFASLAQTSEQNEPVVAATPLGSNISSSGFHSDSGEDEILQSKDSNPPVSDTEIPDHSNYFKETKDDSAASISAFEDFPADQADQQQAPFEQINQESDKLSAATQAGQTENAYFDSHDSVEEYPEIIEKGQASSSESETEYLIKQNNYIVPSQNESSWKAIGIVSVLILILLAVLLFWLLPSDKTVLQETVTFVQTPQVKPEVKPETTQTPTVIDEPVEDTVETTSNDLILNETEAVAVIENENTATSTDTKDETMIETSSAVADTTSETTTKDTVEITKTAYSASSPFFAAKDYKVIFGDNLWKLASHNYINPFLWPHIYHSNNTAIRNPNVLKVNSMITLPTLQGHPSELTKVDRRSIAEGYWLLYQHYKKVGQKNAHYALIGVKWFDADVLEEHMGEILLDDQSKLNARRSDNRMIERAMMYGS